MISGVLAPATAAAADCPETFVGRGGATGVPVICSCKPGQTGGSVWGDGTYAEQSSVCTAALHAGVLGRVGGVVVVQGHPGCDSYPAANHGGIPSTAMGPAPASFFFPKAGAGQCAGAQTAAPAAAQTAEPTQPPQTSPGRPAGSTFGSLAAGKPSAAPAPVPAADPKAPSTFAGLAGSASSAPSTKAPPAPRYDDMPPCPGTFRDRPVRDPVLSCQCPAGSAGGTVWGSDVYSEDSSLCAAARHAGVIGPDGGAVTAQAFAGCQAYESSSRNGVTSNPYGPWSASFVFPDGGAPAQCPSQAPSDQTPSEQTGGLAPCPPTFGGGSPLTCHCGPGAFGGSVWGSGIYTADSSLCTAALHAGVVTHSGGPIAVEPQPGCRTYPASAQNGVTSLSFGSWPTSFTFPATGATGCQQ